MENKVQKADDQILFAMIQDISAYLTGNEYGNAASTAAIAQADIKRDGADQDDFRNIVKNGVLDQNQKVPEKIIEQLKDHPTLVKTLSEEFGEETLTQVMENIQNPKVLQVFGEMLTEYLQTTRKYAEGGQFEKDLKEIDITVGGKDFDVIVFSTEKQKEKGLMNVREMNSNEGGLFVYDDPQHVDFWMKNTFLPLDIVFIGENKKVISVKEGKPETEDYISEDDVKYVLEVNQHSGIEKGDKLEFEDDEFDESSHPELDINKMYVIGSDGKPQMELEGGERIFSRISTKTMINKAKRAFVEKTDSAYKSLGKYVFKEMKAQDSRKPEFVSKPE